MDKLIKLKKILYLAILWLVSGALAGCSDDSNIIGGGAWPVAALVDVTDSDGNSLLDIVNNPDNILADDETVSGIKIVEGDVTYRLDLSDEVRNYLSETGQSQGRSRCYPTEFKGLYLADASTMTFTGGNQGPYLAFGQFEGDREVTRVFTLYLPGRTEGIEIEYHRVRNSKGSSDLSTVTVVDGVRYEGEVPTIVLR